MGSMLTLIRMLNAALALGMNGLTVAQKIGATLETMQAEGRDEPTADEWRDVVAMADSADDTLADAIRNA